MINSALTVNQNPLRCSIPPSGLETFEILEILGMAPLHEVGIENSENGASGEKGGTCETCSAAEEICSTSCRRMSSVISKEPIQTRRTRSVVINSASALSCPEVQRAGSRRAGSAKPLC